MHDEDGYERVGQPDVIKAYKSKVLSVADTNAGLKRAKSSADAQRSKVQRLRKGRARSGGGHALQTPSPVGDLDIEGQSSVEQRLLCEQELLLQENIRLHKELLWVTQQYMAGLQELEGLRKYHRGCQKCTCASNSCSISPSSLSLEKLHPLACSTTRQQQQQHHHQQHHQQQQQPQQQGTQPSAYPSAAAAVEAAAQPEYFPAAALATAGATATVTATTAGSVSGSSTSGRGKQSILAKAAKRFSASATFGGSSSKEKTAAAAAAAAAGGQGGFYYEGSGFPVKHQEKVIVDVGKLLGFSQV